MQSRLSSIYAAGGLIMLVGIIGMFYRIIPDPGSFAVAGAVLVSGALIANAITGQDNG